MDRASIFETTIFKLLEPAAIEEEKVRKAKEEEDRKVAEAKKAKQEETRRIARKEEAARIAKEEAGAREAEERAMEEQRLAEQAERERLAAEALVESSNAFAPDGAVAMDEIETSEHAHVEAQGQPGENEADETSAEASSTTRIYASIRGSRVELSMIDYQRFAGRLRNPSIQEKG